MFTDTLSSPQGALSLAVTVLAAVLGVRLLAPRGASGLAALAYVASLAATWLGRAGLAGSPPPPEPATPVRLAGAALLVFGLLAAGRAAQARALARARGAPASAGTGRKVLLGLALVLAGQLLRAPSPAGLAVGGVAAVAFAWAAWRA